MERTHGDWLSWLQRALHKKDTVRLLLRGLNQQNSSSKLRDGVGSSAHSFQQFHFTTPEYCLVCNRILWGVVVRHGRLLASHYILLLVTFVGLRCSVCGYKCHDKCQSSAPFNCVDAGDEQQRLPRAIQEEDRLTESPEPAPDNNGAVM